MMPETWIPYERHINGREHTVVGELLVCARVWSPQLRLRRDLLVLLPPSYRTSQQRYPVVYMHDGQNLFDKYASFAGEWQVDETMAALAQETPPLEAIVVGIPNGEERRLAEYRPQLTSDKSARGDRYLRFLVETVKPLIDAEFRTVPDREQTALIGSSMGGLISLYGAFRHPEIFGAVGVLSPSLWMDDGAIFGFIEQSPFIATRFYVDIGFYEGRLLPGETVRTMVRSARRLALQLGEQGYSDQGLLRYEEDPEGVHNELSWAKRLPGALRFLLG